MSFSFKKRDFEEDSLKANLNYIDFSDLILFTKEELMKAIDKLPDLKLRPDIELAEKKQASSSKSGLRVGRRDRRPSVSRLTLSSINLDFPYANPIPPSMSHLNLNHFCGTEIVWTMLTTIRPPSKLEENYFSKLVELYQLRYKTRLEDGHGFKNAVFRLSRHPRVMQYKPVDLPFDSFGFKRIDEKKGMTIKEDISYEAYERVPLDYEGDRAEENLAGAALLLSTGDSLDLNVFL